MSYTLPPIALTVPANATNGATVNVSIPGDLGVVSWVKISNLSPFLLNISNLTGGTEWLEPSVVNAFPVPGLTTAIQVTPFNEYGTAAASALSSIIAVTWYGSGEQPSGTFPVSLSGLTNLGNAILGNSAAVTLEQDLVTPFVLTGLAPSHTGFNLYSAAAGIAYLRQSDSSLLRLAYATIAVNLTTPSATYYHDINPDGTYSLGTAHSTQPNYLTIATITTDAGDNITAVTDTRTMATTLFPNMSNTVNAPGMVMYNLHVDKNIQVDNEISVQGLLAVTSNVTGNGYVLDIDGSHDDLRFIPSGSLKPQGITFYCWFPGSPGVQLPVFGIGNPTNVGGFALIDQNGVLHATAPVILQPGNQETGTTGGGFTATAAGQYNIHGINFKTVMTNVPTSITLVVQFQANTSGVTADSITLYGFHFFFTSAAAGLAQWYGTYITVGNCLLAVDASAGTFDHHCEVCGHVASAAPVSALVVSADKRGLSYTCPSCGASEHFNVALSAADEADEAPQGSGEYATTRGAQARLIRQLMTLLGLEVMA